MNTTLLVIDKPVIKEPLKPAEAEPRRQIFSKEITTELDSWDEEGRVIVEQIITSFPRFFPYFYQH